MRLTIDDGTWGSANPEQKKMKRIIHRFMLTGVTCLVIGCAGVFALAQNGPKGPGADKPKMPASWEKCCAFCHGKDGKADTTMGFKMKAADLTSSKVQKKYKDNPKKLVELISKGYAKGDKVIMKPLKDKLKEDEMKKLADYVLKLGKKGK